MFVWRLGSQQQVPRSHSLSVCLLRHHWVTGVWRDEPCHSMAASRLHGGRLNVWNIMELDVRVRAYHRISISKNEIPGLDQETKWANLSEYATSTVCPSALLPSKSFKSESCSSTPRLLDPLGQGINQSRLQRIFRRFLKVPMTSTWGSGQCDWLQLPLNVSHWLPK